MELIVKRNELYHHGILGQKWGQRRWQNEDGSLTEEGRKRYAKYEDKVSKQESKIKKLSEKREKQIYKYDPKISKLRKKIGKNTLVANTGIHLPIRRRFNKWRATVNTGKYNKKVGKIMVTESKINRAKMKIESYDKKMTSLNPEHVSYGKSYVDYISSKYSFI